MSTAAFMAWKFLRENNIDLSSDLFNTLDNLGYRVLPFTEAKTLQQELSIPIPDNFFGLDGFALEAPDDTRYIFYANELSRDLCRRVVLHELGHFVCNASFGGPLCEDIYRKDHDPKETEADEMVYEFIPTPVLYSMGATAHEEIARITQLDMYSVSVIYERVKRYKTNGWIFGAQEREICGFYDNYITANQALLRGAKKKAKVQKVTLAVKRWINRFRWICKHKKIYLALSVGLFSVFILLLTTMLRVEETPNATNEFPVMLTSSSDLIGPTGTTTPEIQTTRPNNTTTETEATTTTAPTTTGTLQTRLAPGTLVYVTKEGERYHLPGCYHIRGKENLIEMTVEQAETAGYEPCKDCI